MGWWLSVSGWIYFDLSFMGALFYHVFLIVSIKKSLSQSFHVIALYYFCQDEDKRPLKVPHSRST